MSILSLLGSNNYIIYNSDIAKLFGVNESILLGLLSSKQDFWGKEDRLDGEGYFFITMEDIENKTSLSPHLQRKALNHLQEIGVIKIKYKGMPSKRYFKIETEKLYELLSI